MKITFFTTLFLSLLMCSAQGAENSIKKNVKVGSKEALQPTRKCLSNPKTEEKVKDLQRKRERNLKSSGEKYRIDRYL